MHASITSRLFADANWVVSLVADSRRLVTVSGAGFGFAIRKNSKVWLSMRGLFHLERMGSYRACSSEHTSSLPPISRRAFPPAAQFQEPGAPESGLPVVSRYSAGHRLRSEHAVD